MVYNIPNGELELALTSLPYQQPQERAPGQRFVFLLWRQPGFAEVRDITEPGNCALIETLCEVHLCIYTVCYGNACVRILISEQSLWRQAERDSIVAGKEAKRACNIDIRACRCQSRVSAITSTSDGLCIRSDWAPRQGFFGLPAHNASRLLKTGTDPCTHKNESFESTTIRTST